MSLGQFARAVCDNPVTRQDRETALTDPGDIPQYPRQQRHIYTPSFIYFIGKSRFFSADRFGDARAGRI
ncbi:hypothetical protein QQ056_11760 [Oscillatoria laete-virens NRMC-F 0139]|nr:hypothetical protein [Oscillatoria laete-virens NRMC-F 0139]